ncbi:MAG: NDP-hexose 2,3-dehydratase family protein [Candidatus Omnitrophica bacterium]|nr:NDP-hexose 2,3-dehydratase family protein [Candidatus Omnitrophota bacterium]
MRFAESKESSFLFSALTEENRFRKSEAFISWFHSRETANRFSVEQIPFDKLDKWRFAKDSQNLIHDSGKFFTVEGIRVHTNCGSVREWEQPIISQPEIGILGIITKKFDGCRYFLMQAKMEPGNININQLSPTVQATKSNYTQVHQGKLPAYLEYFLDRSKSKILIDQLQSEQGSRFLRKRNRNMIIEVDDDIYLHDDFQWLTLGQIKKLLASDNFVNMDARSVISRIPFIDDELRQDHEYLLSNEPDEIKLFDHRLKGFCKDIFLSMLDRGHALHSTDEIISWFTELKTRYEIKVGSIPLKAVSGWIHTDREIYHESGHFFSVIAVSVIAGSREVLSWTQPLLKHYSYGLIGFLTKKINGVLHFLVQGKPEPGNLDVVEMAPTVSCADAEYRMQLAIKPLFLDLFMKAAPNRIRYSSIQSEEGGRFYHWQNKNMIVELGDAESIDIPENYKWMTLGQIMEFTRYNNYFNIEARNILSCLSFI